MLDIGAHTGSWARTIHHLLPDARIYSFEPIPESYSALCRRMEGVSRFNAFNLALGDKVGELEFNRNAFAASSSCLPMAEQHVRAFPKTRDSSVIKVKMGRLDEVASGLTLEDNIMIKVDVQGYEDKVIHGGMCTFGRAILVIAEVSFVTLYEGQPLFEDIHARLGELGFRYVGNLDQMLSPLNGRVLQADAIFLHERLATSNTRTTVKT